MSQVKSYLNILEMCTNGKIVPVKLQTVTTLPIVTQLWNFIPLVSTQMQRRQTIQTDAEKKTVEPVLVRVENFVIFEKLVFEINKKYRKVQRDV